MHTIRRAVWVRNLSSQGMPVHLNRRQSVGNHLSVHPLTHPNPHNFYLRLSGLAVDNYTYKYRPRGNR